MDPELLALLERLKASRDATRTQRTEPRPLFEEPRPMARGTWRGSASNKSKAIACRLSQNDKL